MRNTPLTIFYTDDDVDDREFFKAALEDISSEAELTTQVSGNDLMHQLNHPPPAPSILFLDLNMPGKNGFEVLKEIREKEQTKDIPVVIFSTSDSDEAIRDTMTLGANLFVTKPSSFTTLKEIIRHSLTIDWKTFLPSPEQFVLRIN
jgi:CheY-like chemotaxis protein